MATRNGWLVLLLAAIPSLATAQVPDTDIWLADIRMDRGTLRVGEPRNITDEPGYDNQPCFLPGGKGFLYVRADSLGATDIWRWEPGRVEPVQVTYTPESEYSPTLLDPAGSGFSTVRVEADSTQRLWRFDMDGRYPRLVLSDVDSVGYHAWIDQTHVALFILGNESRKQPHTLRVVDTSTQYETVIARDIGRAIHRRPGTRELSYLVREPGGGYRFFLLEPDQTVGASLIRAVGDGQDAAWYGDRILLMASGAVLYAARPDRDTDWYDVVDLTRADIGTITRIVVSPDRRRLAFVATPKAM